jgi:hypothetical protein
MLRKITSVGDVHIELVSIDGGKLWCWPPDIATKIRASAQERRRAMFHLSDASPSLLGAKKKGTSRP